VRYPTSRERKLIAAIVLAIELLAVYLLIIRPRRAELERIKAELAAQRSMLQLKRSQAELLKELEAKREKILSELSELRKAFLSADEAEGFIKRIADMAESSSLQLIEIQPEGPISSEGDLKTRRLRVALQGRYPDLLELISSFESRWKSVRLEGISITGGSKAQGLRAEIDVVLYWISEDERNADR